MEWESEDRDAWVADAERWICQLKDVVDCKIELDDDGEIANIHVVAGMDRDPRHIVRDVEGLMKARLQMHVYYKKIGVVQMVGGGADGDEIDAAAESFADLEPAARRSGGVTFHAPGAVADEDTPARGVAPREERERTETREPRRAARVEEAPRPAILVAEDASPRIVCSGVGLMASDRMVRAEVQLKAGAVEAGGVAEGANHEDADVALVARATLEAVGQLLVLPPLLHLREVRIAPLGGQDVVLAAVELVEGRRSETCFGSCAANHNRQQAVVHAVLDALNRRLGLRGFKEPGLSGGALREDAAEG